LTAASVCSTLSFDKENDRLVDIAALADNVGADELLDAVEATVSKAATATVVIGVVSVAVGTPVVVGTMEIVGDVTVLVATVAGVVVEGPKHLTQSLSDRARARTKHHVSPEFDPNVHFLDSTKKSFPCTALRGQSTAHGARSKTVIHVALASVVLSLMLLLETSENGPDDALEHVNPTLATTDTWEPAPILALA
jgi:hypothetical protein